MVWVKGRPRLRGGLAQYGPCLDGPVFGQAAGRVERRLRGGTSEKGKILAVEDGEEVLYFRHIFASSTTIIVLGALVNLEFGSRVFSGHPVEG